MDNHNILYALGSLAQLVGALRSITYDLDQVCSKLTAELQREGGKDSRES